MSKADFLKIVKLKMVGNGVNALCELLGEDPVIIVKSEKARKKWAKLLALHEKFEAMTEGERVKWAKPGAKKSDDQRP